MYTTLVFVIGSLRSYFLRTVLTVLGIIVGVMTVVIIVSVGSGVQQIIAGQLQTFGGNTIFTEVRVPVSGSIAQGVEITTLKESDMELVKQLPNVRQVYGVVMAQERLTTPTGRISTTIMGTDPAYLSINKGTIAQGQFFTEKELQGAARVVVLGSEVATRLFGTAHPVGMSVRIRGDVYQVMGVMKSQGTVLFQNMDTMVFIPRTTVQKRMNTVDYLLYFVTEVYDETRIEQTAAYMRTILRRAHRLPPDQPEKDDFTVMSMAEALDLVGTLMTGIQVGLVLLAAISLVVGGVGIMNTMYMGVLERTREIGIRRALGATRTNILWQFLLEAFIMTNVGGFLGVVLGCIGALLGVWIAGYFGFSWAHPIAWEGIVAGYVMALTFGLVFGYFPARTAARLDPIYALRFE